MATKVPTTAKMMVFVDADAVSSVVADGSMVVALEGGRARRSKKLAFD